MPKDTQKRAKKAYNKPTLVVLGALSSLTQQRRTQQRATDPRAPRSS